MRKPPSPRPPPRPPDPAPAGGAPPPARGRKMAAAERREALLEAALPLFARRGWLGTGTRELAAAAGVTEPVLYRHFDDKQALFVAVLGRAAARLEAVLARRVSGAHGAPARIAALAAGLGEILDTRLDDLRVLEVAAGALEASRLAAAARAHLTSLSGVLAQALRGAGLARGVDPAVAGGLLLEVGLGAAVLWPLGVPLTLRRDFRARAVALLLKAFTA